MINGVDSFTYMYIFVAACMRLYLNFLWRAPKPMHFETGCLKSSKVIYFGTNRKRVCDFLLVCHSNHSPVLPRFRDITAFLLNEYTPIPPEFRVFPLDQIAHVGKARATRTLS